MRNTLPQEVSYALLPTDSILDNTSRRKALRRGSLIGIAQFVDILTKNL